MHPLSRLFPGLSNHGHACQYRPRLESLEDRLPLGDALGWLLVCPAWGLMTAAVEHGNVQLDVATEDPPPAKKRELQMICNLQFPRTTTGFETTPSALPRSADRLPQAETSNAPFGPSGVPLGRGETVTLPSAGRESSAEVGVSAQAGQAEPVSTTLAGASGLYASNTNPKRQRGAAETASQRSTTNVGSMPLRFEANQGQTDAAVQFLAHGPGYSLFLTPKEAVMV